MRQGDDLPPSSTHLNPPSLEREVEPARPWLRRGRTQLAIVAACLAVIAASGFIVWFRLARFWFIAAPVPAPAPAATTIAEPVTSEMATTTDELATDELVNASLAADDPVGPAVTRDLPADPAGWRGLSASHDRYGVVALWTDRTLWVSRDDGRTFRQELAAPEPLGAVVVGDDARVYAARHGGRFGVLTPSGRARWRRLDYDQALAIAHGGSWTALLTLSPDRELGLVPILWATADHGESWLRQVVPAAGDLDNLLRVSADGSFELLVRLTGDCAAHRHRLYRGHLDGRALLAVHDAEDPQPFGLTQDGSTPRIVWTDDEAHLEPYHLPLSDWDVVVGAGRSGRAGHSGRAGRSYTLAVADGRLLALSGTRAETLADHVPGRPGALASDGIGRSLAVVGRTLIRHSPAHGWRRIFEVPREDPPAP